MTKQSSTTPAAEFSNSEAAAYLGIAPETLEIWRCTGRHKIPYVKVGRRVRYRRSDLDNWMQSRTMHASGDDYPHPCIGRAV